MLSIERRQALLETIDRQQYISITALCKTLHFSESTVRRDLKILMQENLVSLTRGGVMSNTHPNVETPMLLRHSANRLSKQMIAREAASFVKNNQIIMLDGSTTAMEMIPYLTSKKNLTIITCCLATANRIVELLDCTLLMTGGKYHVPTCSFVGTNAISALDHWYADAFFFSCNAINSSISLTDQGEEIAQLKSHMARHSKQSILLMDSTKFGNTAFYRLDIDDINHIITEDAASHPVREDSEWAPIRKRVIFAGAGSEPAAQET